MSCVVLFRIRGYLQGSLWFCPLVGAILGPRDAAIVHLADTHVTLPAGWRYTLSTASTLVPAIVGATAPAPAPARGSRSPCSSSVATGPVRRRVEYRMLARDTAARASLPRAARSAGVSPHSRIEVVPPSLPGREPRPSAHSSPAPLSALPGALA